VTAGAVARGVVGAGSPSPGAVPVVAGTGSEPGRRAWGRASAADLPRRRVGCQRSRSPSAGLRLPGVGPPLLPGRAARPRQRKAARGSFTLFEALFWTTAGSVVGAFASYGLGAVLGIERLSPRRSDAAAPGRRRRSHCRVVLRHGGKAVFFGRMLPIFRSLISVPAGVVRMPLWKSGLFTLAGSLVWNTVFVQAARRAVAHRRGVRRHPAAYRHRGRGRSACLVHRCPRAAAARSRTRCGQRPCLSGPMQ
jgi:membrane protein YqaA with SNARE-associated domain